MPTSESIRGNFYDRLASGAQIGSICDDFPGILYFVKDAESRFISANLANLKWLGLRSEKELVGTTDYDFFPNEMAENFVRGDREILESGQPMLGQPELIIGKEGEQKWFLTTKRPLFDRQGKTIGIVGATQSREELPSYATANNDLRPVVDFIRRHQNRTISADEMAEVAGISERQLYRKFSDAYQTTPLRFALLTRLRSARRALAETPLPISEIALRYGFCDQSAFTKHFRKEVGETPSRYRRMMAERGGREDR